MNVILCSDIEEVLTRWKEFISSQEIESIVNSAGDPTGDYESVRIKNHERLRTTNLNHYILPNQFDVGLIRVRSRQAEIDFRHMIRRAVQHHLCQRD